MQTKLILRKKSHGTGVPQHKRPWRGTPLRPVNCVGHVLQYDQAWLHVRTKAVHLSSRVSYLPSNMACLVACARSSAAAVSFMGLLALIGRGGRCSMGLPTSPSLALSDHPLPDCRPPLPLPVLLRRLCRPRCPLGCVLSLGEGEAFTATRGPVKGQRCSASRCSSSCMSCWMRARRSTALASSSPVVLQKLGGCRTGGYTGAIG